MALWPLFLRYVTEIARFGSQLRHSSWS